MHEFTWAVIGWFSGTIFVLAAVVAYVYRIDAHRPNGFADQSSDEKRGGWFE